MMGPVRSESRPTPQLQEPIESIDKLLAVPASKLVGPKTLLVVHR
jgi:hypothetical protein